MKIAIQTWGSTGDVHPFIALAAGLARRGHEVTLILTTTDRRDFTQTAAQHGFRVVSAGQIGATITEVNNIGRRVFTIKDPLRQLSAIYRELFDPYAETMYAAAREIFPQQDLVIGHCIHHVARLAAEQAGKPYLTVSLNHGLVHSQHLPPHPLPNLGSWLNGLSWRLFDVVFDRITLPVINSFRTNHGGKPITSTRDVWESPLCNLVAVSPALCRPQTDWGSNQKLCGFINLPAIAAEPHLPQHVHDFLDAGPPPVFFTFGSMMGLPEPSEELEQTTLLWEEAARLAGCRAILQTHWSMASHRPQSSDILCIEYVDHALIFPRCAAVVHHGGAGTTQSSLRSGCPSVVVAHIVDQYLFGAELLRLGVGAKPLMRNTLTAHKLARAIHHVLHHPEMRPKAAALGEAMRNEDGLSAAVQYIEQIATGLGLHS